ncbi:MAG: (deoxy)nucleoside triphosphate pyrophosphohydrolase [Bacteroidia bacterium]|jgi:8-oxo-dGTP diphosphatase
MIDVCCAIFVKEAKILAVQRGPESSHPWQWEFPGGKIHFDENEEQCIIREIEEELSVEVDVLDRLQSIEFDYGTKQVRLIPFVCQIISGEIRLTEHLAQIWFCLEEWKSLNWSGADYELILRNQENLKRVLKENL